MPYTPTTWVTGDVITAAKANNAETQYAQAVADSHDVGDIVASGRAAKSGFLLCNGAAVSRATYAALFGQISTAYGVGNGSTTFNLPDLRGRHPMGVAASGLGAVLGEAGGARDHTHTGPSHTHPYTDIVQHIHPAVVTDPQHAHGGGAQGGAPKYQAGGDADPIANYDRSSDAASTGITVATQNPAGSVATGNTQAASTGATGAANAPYQTVNFFIKY